MKRKSHDPTWLRAKGYDGLYATEGPCGCGLDDFAPCGEGPFPECVPAVQREDPEGRPLYFPARRVRHARS